MAKQAVPITSVLMYGRDVRLVETRAWVLEKEGYRVFTALRLPDLREIAMRESIDLFLLCDSLPSDSRSEVLSLIRSSWPGAKRLVLAPVSLSVEIEPAEEVFHAVEGPGKLVKAIRTLIVNGPASAS